MQRSSRFVLAGLLGSICLPVPAAQAAAACPTWTMHTIASGLGVLESVLADGTGGMLVSTGSSVIRVRPDGTSTTVMTASSPGQLIHVGSQVVFPTGDAAQSGAFGTADGTLQVLGGPQLATGLTMPNGLAVDAAGDYFTTRDVGSGTGITRVHGSTVQTSWAADDDTNGIAVDDAHGVLYVDHTFTPAATVDAVSLSDPSRITQIADLTSVGSAVPKGLDGLIMRGSLLYLAANGSGEVLSLDTITHATCLIASGLMNTSAVAVGAGPGWRSDALYVVGFDGLLRELDPPVTTAPPVTSSASAAAPSPVRTRHGASASAPRRGLAATGGLPYVGLAVLWIMGGAWIGWRPKVGT